LVNTIAVQYILIPSPRLLSSRNELQDCVVNGKLLDF